MSSELPPLPGLEPERPAKRAKPEKKTSHPLESEREKAGKMRFANLKPASDSGLRLAVSESMGTADANSGLRKQKPLKSPSAEKRGAKPGERRRGRQKGTPNKRTIELRELLESMGMGPNDDPVLFMARVSKGEVEGATLEQRIIIFATGCEQGAGFRCC